MGTHIVVDAPPMMTVMLQTSVTTISVCLHLHALRIGSVTAGMQLVTRSITTVFTVEQLKIVITLLDVAPVVVLISTVNTQNQFVEIITNVDAMWTKIVRLEMNVIKIPISVKLK